MANEEIFNTPELRLRISELSYEDLKEAGYEKEIRRIYAEETGRELPANVTIIPSREVKNVKDESGYVGIAIHFHDEKKKINQVYVVSRGSQTMEDWLYNFFGILSGQDDSQYVNTRIFVDEVEKRAKKLAKGKEPLTIGLGHSQADNHHLNLRLAASDDVKLYFDKLYSVNGAQPNINLLWLIDDDFQWEVAKKFNVDHRDKFAIFTLPPVEVAKFAEEYYKNKKVDGISVTDNMVRYVSRNDPLYGVSIREAGFIDVGEMILIETNPDYPGLRDYVEQIPEEEIRKIQALFVEYRESYRNGGLQAVLREAIGIDLDLINELTDNPSSTISNRSGDLIAMIQSMREKFPNVLAAVAYIRKHADPVLSALVEGGYIEEAQKKEVISELTGLEEDLQALYQVVEDLIASHEKLIEDIQEKNYFRGSWKTMLLPSEYINAVRKLVKIYKRASGRIDTFSELLKKLAPIEASHSVEEMLNALQRVKGKDEGLWKGYREGDMLYYKGGKGGEPIEVNISSAVRMYQKGMAIFDEQESILEQFGGTLQQVFVNDYQARVKIVRDKINHIEANPKSFYSLGGIKENQMRTSIWSSNSSLYGSTEIVKVSVNDSFSSLNMSDIGSVAPTIHNQIIAGRRFVRKMRKSIEDLFEADKKLSAIFEIG